MEQIKERDDVSRVIDEIIPEKGIVNYITSYAKEYTSEELATIFMDSIIKIELMSVDPDGDDCDAILKVYFKDCEEVLDIFYSFSSRNPSMYINTFRILKNNTDEIRDFVIEKLNFTDEEYYMLVEDLLNYNHQIHKMESKRMKYNEEATAALRSEDNDNEDDEEDEDHNIENYINEEFNEEDYDYEHPISIYLSE